jgi:hypothetical protein
VDYRIDAAVERGLEHGGIGQVALDDVDLRIGVGLEIHDANRRSALGQLSDRVPADEPRPSGDEDPASVQI